MEQEYETTEAWYPWHGGGEMIEIGTPYSKQTETPLCTEDAKRYFKQNPTLVTTLS